MRFVLILLLIPTIAYAEWVDVPRVRNSGYGGVFGEVQDRLRSPGKFSSYPFNIWCHEDVHRLNHQGRSRGRMFYLPGGRACIVPSCGLRVRDIAGVVPAQHRGTLTYQLYFLGRAPRGMTLVVQTFGLGPSGGIPENPALIPFDELSAYTCEAVAIWERGRDPTRAIADASWLSYYCSLIALHLRERGYPHWEELHTFTTDAYAHLQQIARTP